MPEISVVVPVYKVEKYLDRCVKSVLNQTFTDFELILVDDGSPDNCPKMCDDWAKKDSRIRVIHKENGGLSSARNAALQIFSGSYVTFIDSDDWIEKDALEVLYHNLKITNSDVSVGNFTRELSIPKDNNNDMRIYTQKEYMDIFLKYTSQRTVYYAWGKLYTRAIAQKIIYPEGYTSEDVQGTFYALLNSKKIVETSKVIYHYFFNDEGITGKPINYTHMDMFHVWDNVIQYARINNSEYVSQCEYNRKRILLGGLLAYIIKPISPSYTTYINDIQYIKKQLNSSFLILMKGPLPFTKKIILMGIRITPKKLFFYLAHKNFKKGSVK